MNTDEPLRCPQCGAPLPGDAPHGLCPRCLGAMNLGTDTLGDVETAKAPPPLTPAELAPHFPQLEIVDCLGRGGMGVVYKARQKSLDRLVALKLLAPERVHEAKFAERFAREAQALARLNHPNIVTVHDFGQAGGFYFLLMEFVDGVNLRQAMKAGRFTPDQALAIVPPICEALEYAHEHGIVHRDIKPENLLLDREGRVKIADFGIAKILHADGSDVSVAESQPVGTPQYMAPEQKAHHTTDHRADIYSLGVVFYEMLTGELPAEKLEPPSRKVEVDVRIDEIVLRALEKAPEMRFQTATEMRTQVETVASQSGASRERPAADQSTPRLLRIGTTYIAAPEKLGTFAWQIAFFRSRTPLRLDERQLEFVFAQEPTSIPLKAIKDLSVGRFPRTLYPAGIDFISLTYMEDGKSKRLYLTPNEGIIWSSPRAVNRLVSDWLVAIRAAIIAATGAAPPSTPIVQLGNTPPLTTTLSWFITWFGILLLTAQIVWQAVHPTRVSFSSATPLPAKAAAATPAKLAITPEPAPLLATKAYTGDIETDIDAGGSVAPPENASPPPNQESDRNMVFFTVPEECTQAILRNLKAKRAQRVEIWDTHGNNLAHGTLVAVDKQIDASTGTLKCQASVVPNADVILYPNQFANVRLHLEIKAGVTLVPATAIKWTRPNKTVYVVDADGRVSARPVTTAATNDKVIEIVSGLAPGEIVLVTPGKGPEEGALVRYQLIDSGSR